LKISYTNGKPIRDENGKATGMKITQVQSMNPKGSIPDFLKNLMSKKQVRGIIGLVDYTLKNYEASQK